MVQPSRAARLAAKIWLSVYIVVSLIAFVQRPDYGSPNYLSWAGSSKAVFFLAVLMLVPVVYLVSIGVATLIAGKFPPDQIPLVWSAKRNVGYSAYALAAASLLAALGLAILPAAYLLAK